MDKGSNRQNSRNVLVRRGDSELGIAQFLKARELNSSFSDWRFAGALVFAGDAQKAIEVCEEHMRLDPFYPAFAQAWAGRAYYMLSRYQEALAPLRACVVRTPNFRSGHLWLAATYAQLGQLPEARTAAAEVLRINPGWTIQRTGRRVNVFKQPDHAEHFFDGLRKAGLPEC